MGRFGVLAILVICLQASCVLARVTPVQIRENEQQLEEEELVLSTTEASIDDWTTLSPPSSSSLVVSEKEVQVEVQVEEEGKEGNVSSTTIKSTVDSNQSSVSVQSNKGIPEELAEKKSNSTSDSTLLVLANPNPNSNLIPNPKRETSSSLTINSIGIPSFSSLVSKGIVTAQDLTEDLDKYVAPLYIRKNFPAYLAGFDESGIPIIVAEFGRMPLRDLVEQGPEMQEEMIKYLLQLSYKFQKILQASGANEFLYIIDFEGLQYKQLTSLPNLTFLLRLARTFQDLILRHLAGAYVINADFFTHQLIRAVKPVFGGVLAKTEIYGTSKPKWIPVLRRAFGAKNLPEWYGGSKSFKPISVFG